MLLVVWALALSRHDWAPRTKLYWLAASLVGALLVGWALALAGLGWSAWQMATQRTQALESSVGWGLVVASIGAGVLLVASAISFVLLAKWTWQLNERIGSHQR
jgi:hypothetical protein